MSDKKFTTDENLKKLGKQVRQLRNGHKWSQQKLSEVSGLAVRTISRIERGLMNPSFEVLTILVDVLGISFDSLFTSSDDQDIDIQEMIGLYRACSDQGRQLILTVVRAMARDLIAK
mgnify:FL=1